MKIALWSIAFAAYEAYALLRGKPTITTLSTKKGWEWLVWGWFWALALHLIRERRKGKVGAWSIASKA